VIFPEAAGSNPPTALGGVTITFDSTPARLISVSSTEIVALAPFSLTGKWQSLVRATYQGRTSNPIPVVVHDSDPQVYTTGPAQINSTVTIWTADAWKVDGKNRTRIIAPGQLKWGDRISIRLTGLGQGTIPLADDDAAQEQSFTPAVPLKVYLGGDSTSGPFLTPVSTTWAPGGQSGIVEVVVDLPPSQPAIGWELFGVSSWRAPRQLHWPFAGTGDSLTYYISNRSGISRTTSGTESAVQVGYARVTPGVGLTAPSGIAIFNYSDNGILLSEAAVPASPLTQGGRVYAEIASPVDTGVAIANSNDQPAVISFYYTDASGSTILSGSTTISANSQIASFLDQAPFVTQQQAPDLRNARTFTFYSSIPIGVTALRGYVNERGEFLITTLPVIPIDGTAAAVTGFPHFADGGGWISAVILVNPTDSPINGAARFYSKGSATAAGSPVTLTANGTSANSFSYSIPARSAFKLQTSGSGEAARTGWVSVTPASNSGAPSGLLVFSYQSKGVRVSEAGVPAIPAGNAFRIYAEAGGSSGSAKPGAIQTGIAVCNPTTSNVTASFDLTNLDGTSTGFSGALTIPATGQIATFLNQIPGFSSAPSTFKGILRVGGPGLLVTGLRGRSNERGDFLITTTAPVSENSTPSTAGFVFPQLADGGGYSTQVILFSGAAGQATNGSLQFISQSGQPLIVGLR
jgi:uncharacterized protein (TIGR03437 family)